MGKTNTNWKVVDIFKARAEEINSKEHFSLKKYEVTLKEIAKVRFGNHCKYNVNYPLSMDSKNADEHAC